MSLAIGRTLPYKQSARVVCAVDEKAREEYQSSVVKPDPKDSGRIDPGGWCGPW